MEKIFAKISIFGMRKYLDIKTLKLQLLDP